MRKAQVFWNSTEAGILTEVTTGNMSSGTTISTLPTRHLFNDWKKQGMKKLPTVSSKLLPFRALPPALPGLSVNRFIDFSCSCGGLAFPFVQPFCYLRLQGFCAGKDTRLSGVQESRPSPCLQGNLRRGQEHIEGNLMQIHYGSIEVLATALAVTLYGLLVYKTGYSLGLL